MSRNTSAKNGTSKTLAKVKVPHIGPRPRKVSVVATIDSAKRTPGNK